MPDSLAPGTRLGPYEIEALIGAGGLGRVYRARDPRLSRGVAIKTLSPAAAADPDGIRRFRTEARIVGALDHPNLLVVYDVGDEGDVPYLVSELLQGETLRERLRRQGPFSERQAIDLITQVVRGLAAAHTRGFVHRDLKPENLFITADRRVKILDFGIAKRVEVASGGDAAGTVVHTVTGAIVGTVGYMAPEQVRGEPVDARADIFAVGVVLHELLTGSAPFQRETAIATLTAILADDPPPLPATVSPALSRIVRRCLEKSSEDRIHSAHDLGIALELLDAASTAAPGSTSSGAVGDATGGAPKGPAAMPRREALRLGAASLAFFAAGAAGGALLRGWRADIAAPSFRRLTFRRGLIRSARVGPDGQTILFGALWDDQPCQVHTARMDGPESRALDLPSANVLAVSRSGELALSLGPHRDGVITYGTLATVPLSGGAPRELAVDVKFADWSPDGSELAIIRRVDGRDRLEYPVGNVLVQPVDGGPTGLGFARIAPDGRHVAFAEFLSPGSLIGRVAIVDRGGKVTRLTDEFINLHGLAWRGNEIWFTAADDPLFRALRTVSADGGAARTVTRFPGNVTIWDAVPDGRLVLAQTDDRAVMVVRREGEAVERDLSWLDASWVQDLSRDGRQLLFNETGQGGGPHGTIYLRGTDGSPAVRLGVGYAYSLSPDGRWAACSLANTDQGTSSRYLDLVPTGAGEPQRIEGAGHSFTGAQWLPDPDLLVVSATEAGRRARLHLLDRRQGSPRPLTPEGVTAWVVSPDGSTIATTGLGDGIRLFPVDGSAPRDLPPDPERSAAREQPVAWMNDGLLVTRPEDPETASGLVLLVDLRTGRRSPWADLRLRDRAGIMALTSVRVTPDGRTRAYTWHRALSSIYLSSGLT